MNKLLILVVFLLPVITSSNITNKNNTQQIQANNLSDIIFEQSLSELTTVSEQLEDLSHKLEIIQIYKQINHE